MATADQTLADKARTESLREIQGLMRVTGHYTGPVNGDPTRDTQDSARKFMAERQIDMDKISTQTVLSEVLNQLRPEVATSPRSLESMNKLKDQGADGIRAMQYAMRAMGAPVPITGLMNRQTVNGFKNLQERSADTDANPSTRTADNTPHSPTQTAPADTSPSTNPRPLVAGDRPDQQVNTGDMMKMIFLAIAQMLGINLTTLQTAQATPSNRPAVTTTAAPAAVTPVSTASPTPTPVSLSVGGGKLETDDQRQDRLGMSPQQYDALKADQESWQADKDAGTPQKRPSPFHIADNNDKAMQQRLGLDDQKWAALKQENQRWQTDKDNGFAHERMGPLARAEMNASHNQPMAAAAPAAPEMVQVGDGKLQGDQQHREFLGMTPREYTQLMQRQNQWQARIDSGGGAARTSPVEQAQQKDRQLQREFNLDDQAWAVLKKEQLQWKLDKESGRGNSKTDPFTIARTQAQSLGAFGPGAADTPQADSPRMTPVQYRTPPAVRAPFNASAQMNLDVVNQMMEMRAQYRAQGWNPRLAAQQVNNTRTDFLVNQQGMDPRSAAQQVATESRATDMQEKHQIAQDRQYTRDAQQAIRQAEQMERREAAAQQRANREFGRDLGAFAGGASVLTGANGRQAGAARDIGRVLPSLLGGFGIGGGAPQTPSQSRAFGNDMGTAARGAAILSGANGREAAATRDLVGAGTNILSRIGVMPGSADTSRYQVITYPQQSQRGGYVPQPRVDQNFSYDSDQLKGKLAGAADDGVTPEQRDKIIRDYEAQRSVPAAEPAARQQRQPSSMDFAGG